MDFNNILFIAASLVSGEYYLKSADHLAVAVEDIMTGETGSMVEHSSIEPV